MIDRWSRSSGHVVVRFMVPAAMIISLAACKREERPFRVSVPYAGTTEGPRLTTLQPGPHVPVTHLANDYENNAWALGEGKRLFTQYNCSGCHANGGGGMGPALRDARWIYGSNPEQIYSTIVQGRPNGMPSFGGKIPDNQIWQIAAFVRSMSGLTPMLAATNRDDHMEKGVPENSRNHLKPAQSFLPPAAQADQ